MSIKVIISGHSRGLGEALAQVWLQRGAQVLGLARQSNQNLAQRYPQQFSDINIDLSDLSALQTLLKQQSPLHNWTAGASELWLFNNAGTVTPSNLVGEQTPQTIINAIALNITAPLLLSNALASWHKPLNIVHISSGAGRKNYSGWSIYGASKAALDHHALVANSENQGINIVALAPGVVDTAMQQQLREDSGFPLQANFVELQQVGGLQSAKTTADKIVRYCISETFAHEAVVDIRNIYSKIN